MPFEMPRGNAMEGKFNYPDLERRLKYIKAALDKETDAWATQGLVAAAAQATVAVNLKHQFDQASSFLKHGDMPHHLTIDKDNQFVWILTYFGRPMTNFDSGLIRIKLSFSPRFPEEQPRVKFETNIFHHLVAPDGTFCYTPECNKPARREDITTHIEAILTALEEDEPAYDPRKIVNLEANQLFWNGGKESKKIYHRRLRRSVQDSME